MSELLLDSIPKTSFFVPTDLIDLSLNTIFNSNLFFVETKMNPCDRAIPIGLLGVGIS